MPVVAVQKRVVDQNPYHPTTFLERGVVVFFTTPILNGSRVRANERSKLELIVPSISGTRGFNVLPWSCITEFCTMTLHDRTIQERIADARAVTPSVIRSIVSDVARAGHAGRQARAAAEALHKKDHEAQILANYNLLLMLIAQVERREPELCLESSPDIEERAKRAINHIAPAIGLDPNVIASSLEQLASDFRNVGLGPSADTAPLPRAVARLSVLRDAMTRLSSSDQSETATRADIVRTTADLTLSSAPILLAEARRLAENVAELLARWQTDSKTVVGTLVRPDWLLDGWGPICALWETSEQSPAGRHKALVEMMEQVPVIPKELGEWVDAEVTDEMAIVCSRRLVELNKDWRTGLLAVDLIAQSERRCALVLT